MLRIYGEAINVPVNETEKIILSIIAHSPAVTRTELAHNSGKTIRTVQRGVSSLKAKGVIKRTGSDKNGY